MNPPEPPPYKPDTELIGYIEEGRSFNREIAIMFIVFVLVMVVMVWAAGDSGRRHRRDCQTLAVQLREPGKFVNGNCYTQDPQGVWHERPR